MPLVGLDLPGPQRNSRMPPPAAISHANFHGVRSKLQNPSASSSGAANIKVPRGFVRSGGFASPARDAPRHDYSIGKDHIRMVAQPRGPAFSSPSRLPIGNFQLARHTSPGRASPGRASPAMEWNNLARTLAQPSGRASPGRPSPGRASPEMECNDHARTVAPPLRPSLGRASPARESDDHVRNPAPMPPKVAEVLGTSSVLPRSIASATTCGDQRGDRPFVSSASSPSPPRQRDRPDLRTSPVLRSRPICSSDRDQSPFAQLHQGPFARLACSFRGDFERKQESSPFARATPDPGDTRTAVPRPQQSRVAGATPSSPSSTPELLSVVPRPQQSRVAGTASSSSSTPEQKSVVPRPQKSRVAGATSSSPLSTPEQKSVLPRHQQAGEGWHSRVTSASSQIDKVIASESTPTALPPKDTEGDVLHTSCDPLPKLHIPSHSSIKLAVFDFDCTLTACHIYASLAGNTEAPNTMLTVPSPHARTECGQLLRLASLDKELGAGSFALEAFGGHQRVIRLRHVLETLRDGKVECVILSRSMVGPIQKCLDQLDLLSFFTCIYGSTGSMLGMTPFDMNLSPPTLPKEEQPYLGTSEMATGATKAATIANCLKVRGLEFNQAVFLDDDMAEEMFDEGFASEIPATPPSTSAGSTRSTEHSLREEMPSQADDKCTVEEANCPRTACVRQRRTSLPVDAPMAGKSAQEKLNLFIQRASLPLSGMRSMEVRDANTPVWARRVSV